MRIASPTLRRSMLILPLAKPSVQAPSTRTPTSLPEASPPPDRPHGLHTMRSTWVLNTMSARARTTLSTPSPPRRRPAPAESGMSLQHSTTSGNFDSVCSFGLLWVSPSLMQTVAETPSSLCLAPQPPPSGPIPAMKNCRVLASMPWKLAITRSCLLYTSDAADDLLCVDLGG